MTRPIHKHKREHVRVPYWTELIVTADGESHAAETRDLSREGVYVISSKAVEVGTSVEFLVSAQDAKPVSGTVVRQGNPHEPPGFAVRFSTNEYVDSLLQHVEEFRFGVTFPLSSNWKTVEGVRRSVLGCLTAVSSDHEFSHALAMVAGELLENGIKYGAREAADPCIRLRVHGGNRTVLIDVFSPAGEDSTDTRSLFALLDWMRAFPTAQDAFQARIQQLAESSFEHSRLGLVRMVYEGGCRIEANCPDPRLLHVRATASPNAWISDTSRKEP